MRWARVRKQRIFKLVFMNDYIEIISYTATTTALDGTATTTTVGQYVIPFLLFQFMVIVISFTIMAITLYILLKRKWHLNKQFLP